MSVFFFNLHVCFIPFFKRNVTWWNLHSAQICLLSKPQSLSLPKLQKRDPNPTSQMELSLASTVSSMVRLQRHDAYLFSDHIPGGS